MPCNKPLEGWYSKEINPSGKRSIVFTPTAALQPDDPIEIPCGQCHACRLEKSRQWAMRCLHEASLHPKNCFITLTFNEENLNKRDNPQSLNKEEFQQFMKRLRFHLVPKNPYKKFSKDHPDYDQQKRKRDQWQRENGIRFYMCGEYGDKYGRPHYHAILFNCDFEDKKPWKLNNGSLLYRSKTLEELWPYGYSSIGDVTFESAAYVARYVMKKRTGENAIYSYCEVDFETGEMFNFRLPEYNDMSRRPGIAAWWYEKYSDDLKKDFVTVNGKKMRVPKYYDRLLEKIDPIELQDLKQKRVEKAQEHAIINTRERLDQKEAYLAYKCKQLPRKLDYDEH